MTLWNKHALLIKGQKKDFHITQSHAHTHCKYTRVLLSESRLQHKPARSRSEAVAGAHLQFIMKDIYFKKLRDLGESSLSCLLSAICEDVWI